MNLVFGRLTRGRSVYSGYRETPSLTWISSPSMLASNWKTYVKNDLMIIIWSNYITRMT